MPIRYRIVPEHELVLVHGSGNLRPEDFLESMKSLYSEPDFEPGLRQLCDLREVRQLEGGYESAQDLIARFSAWTPLPAGGRVALVARERHVYGLIRMFEILADPLPPDVRTFEDLDAARRWLDLPEDAPAGV